MTTGAWTGALPGDHLDLTKMPGHWVLARMGKRVLRPGGVELTKRMLDALGIDRDDRVVELAPGLGKTTRLVLQREPQSYVGVERDEAATAIVRRLLRKPNQACRQGTAAATGLDDASATVVFAEAMLTMQTAAQKRAIVREAFRVLEPGGRYGIHELGLTPDDLNDTTKNAINRELSAAIRVGARPLTCSEWRHVLESEGFVVDREVTAPMHLLEPRRLIADEGAAGALRLAYNLATTPAARRRVMEMRGVFRQHRDALCAVALVARKPSLRCL